MALARIVLPSGVKRGDLVEVRIAIQHPMETGFRREGGERVPRNAIHSLACVNRSPLFAAKVSVFHRSAVNRPMNIMGTGTKKPWRKE